MSDTRSFVVIPVRILNLPNLTIQLLKFYEKIFQFWHSGNECFLNNSTLMEYCGMKSMATLSDAFKYFEDHQEMKRVQKDGKRYIIPPQPKLSTDDEKPLSPGQDPLSLQRDPPSRHSETPPLATARHNINNINNNNINKSFCASEGQKMSRPVDKSTTESKAAPQPRPSNQQRYDNERRHHWANQRPATQEVKSMVKEWGPGHPDYDIQHAPVQRVSLSEMIGIKKSAIVGGGVSALHELAKRLNMTTEVNHSLNTA